MGTGASAGPAPRIAMTVNSFTWILIQVRVRAAGEFDTYILREGQGPEAVSANEGKNA